MTFTQLEIFLKIAELKSFTLCAEYFDISQSAVSHAIKNLEKEWQVSLFYRQQNNIELTETGQTLIMYAREIVNLNHTLKQELKNLHGLNQGTLRIGSFGASASNVLIPMILEKFQQCYPNIDIYLKEGSDEDIATWLNERQIDLGFVVLPEERFDAYPLTEDIFVALLPKSHPLAQHQAVRLEELAQYPFLMTAAGSQNQVNHMFRSQDIKPNIKGHFSQLITIINMVNNQVGVSIVADLAVNKELLTLYPNVVKRPLSPNLKRAIALAVKNKQHISPASKAFIEIANQLFH